jgi:zinc D-Ala-D-Ala carboxypeptidase
MNKLLIGTLIVVVASVILAIIFRENFKSVVNRIMALQYFKIDEFDSPAIASVDTAETLYEKNGKSYIAGSGAKHMKSNHLYMLDKARGEFEKNWNKEHPEDKGVFKITSGYRTQHYNDTLSGSVKNSSHILGLASDISVAGWSEAKRNAMLKALYNAGFRRFGFMANAIHVDNDPNKNPTLWDYGAGSMTIIDPATLVNN